MTDKNSEEKHAELITEELFREAYQFEEARKPPLIKVIASYLKCNKNSVLNFFPIIKWLPKYKIKENILGDVIAGVTVAVMHIPHGLAYAPLGGVQPVVGFYMAVFPVFIYMLLGTSRHISIGTFAVLCAMVGQIVMKYELPSMDSYDNANVTNSTAVSLENKYRDIEVGAAVCLLVGLWQTLLGILRLGALTVIMSESLVSGFTAGAAVHVLSYQLKNLFGVNVASFSGVFKLTYIYIDFFSKIKTINYVTACISAVCIFVLLLFNEYLKPLIKKKYPKNKFPVPIELIVVLFGITVSYFANLSDNYKVKIVGHLPKGMPVPSAPPVGLLPSIIIDSLIVAIVALAINLSLAKIFGKKGFYAVSNNQEFLAYGASNIFGSFFQCLPSAASLSRSTIQFTVGGKTQIASLFSIFLIILILLFAGPVFEPVPYCVLSSIVAVTLKGLLMQIGDLCGIWKQSTWDGIVWLGTFLSVIILDLDIGLGVGLLLSIISIIFKSYSFKLVILGRVPNTNIYLDIAHYKLTQTIPNILILQPVGNLNFANSSKFEEKIAECFTKTAESADEGLSYVILNLSSVTQIDPTLVNSLRDICKYLKKSKCELYLTDCNVSVYRMFEICNLFKDIPKEQILASVADAVDYLTKAS